MVVVGRSPVHPLLSWLLTVLSAGAAAAPWDGSNLQRVRSLVSSTLPESRTWGWGCTNLTPTYDLPSPYSPLCQSQLPKLPAECQPQSLLLRGVTFTPPLHTFHECIFVVASINFGGQDVVWPTPRSTSAFQFAPCYVMFLDRSTLAANIKKLVVRGESGSVVLEGWTVVRVTGLPFKDPRVDTRYVAHTGGYIQYSN